jgi:hypothetical protein
MPCSTATRPIPRTTVPKMRRYDGAAGDASHQPAGSLTFVTDEPGMAALLAVPNLVQAARAMRA